MIVGDSFSFPLPRFKYSAQHGKLFLLLVGLMERFPVEKGLVGRNTCKCKGKCKLQTANCILQTEICLPASALELLSSLALGQVLLEPPSGTRSPWAAGAGAGAGGGRGKDASGIGDDIAIKDTALTVNSFSVIIKLLSVFVFLFRSYLSFSPLVSPTAAAASQLLQSKSICRLVRTA